MSEPGGDKMTAYSDITGPFRSEQQFKQAVIQFWRTKSWADDVLEIENEEKAPGTPAVFVCGDGYYSWCEFKLSDVHSVIEFQKTQPLFYKQHPKLGIDIIAWDAPRGCAALVRPEKIIAAKSLRYKLTEDDE
jgi:hypothetical protein